MPRRNSALSLSELRLVLVSRGIFAGLGLALACMAAGTLAAIAGLPVGSAATVLGLGVALGWGITWTMYLFTVARPLGRSDLSLFSLESPCRPFSRFGLNRRPGRHFRVGRRLLQPTLLRASPREAR